MHTHKPSASVDNSTFLSVLETLFPDAYCELTFSTPLELLIAVMLSAQATDVSVNKVTPALFAQYKTAQHYASASQHDIEQTIRSIGLYKTKAKNIIAMARILVDRHEGDVPQSREALEALPGVGRKTANVVVSVAFAIPAFAVDTHVMRVAYRLGFITDEHTSARVVEDILTFMIPQDLWSVVHHRMIFFGRYHCKAKKPQCDLCPFAGHGCQYYDRNLQRSTQ